MHNNNDIHESHNLIQARSATSMLTCHVLRTPVTPSQDFVEHIITRFNLICQENFSNLSIIILLTKPDSQQKYNLKHSAYEYFNSHCNQYNTTQYRCFVRKLRTKLLTNHYTSHTNKKCHKRNNQSTHKRNNPIII